MQPPTTPADPHPAPPPPGERAATVRYALAVHGGAGAPAPAKSPEASSQRKASLARALAIGRDCLQKGGSSLETVEQVIRLLEDDPLFNAGRGAVLNEDGQCELDAAIMDGSTLACGAVAALQSVRNPISLARLVMTQTRHVLLVGRGAECFARSTAIERANADYFITPERRAQWRAARRKHAADSAPCQNDDQHGTVGCVALDSRGNLSAGTSTGGILLKKPGRVGDSPLIGAGTYADNQSCAISCTGNGERFIRHVAAYTVSALITYQGLSLKDAAAELIDHCLKPGDGGLIAVDRRGQIAMRFSTERMARGAADSTGHFHVALQ